MIKDYLRQHGNKKKKEATNSILSTRETWNEHNTQETAANKM